MSNSIAARNNEAVAFLQSGAREAAVRNLKLAVTSIVAEPMVAPAIPSEDSPVQTDLNRDAPIRCVEISNKQQKKECQFLFLSALTVSEEAAIPLKSSVVLYNLALIHHMTGVRECASKKIIAARRLYLLALDLVKKHSESQGSKKALLLSLAIANNLGEIYMQQSHDVKEARKCFSLLHEILRHLDLNANGTDASLDPNESEYSFFYLNAMVRGTGDFVVATAA